MLIRLAYFTLFIDFTFINGFLYLPNDVSIEGMKYLPVLFLVTVHFLSTQLALMPRVSRDVLPIVIYILALLVSTAWSVSVSYSLRTLIPWVALGLLIELLQRASPVFLFRLERQVIFVAAILLAMCAVNFLFGLISGDALVTESSGAVRLAFVGGLPAWYAHYIVLSGIVFYFAWRYGRGSGFAYLLLFVFIVLILLVMNIRAYLLGLLAAIFLCEIITLKSFYKKLFSIAIAVTIVATLVSVYEPLKTKMYTVGGGDDVAQLENIRLSDRDKIAIYLIGESYDYSGLLAGAGAGAARYFLRESQYFDNTIYAHSDYVRVLSELGYLGLSLYFVVLFLLYGISLRIFKVARKMTTPAGMIYGASSVAAVLFFAVAGTVYDMFTPVNILFLFTLISFGKNRIKVPLKC